MKVLNRVIICLILALAGILLSFLYGIMIGGNPINTLFLPLLFVFPAILIFFEIKNKPNRLIKTVFNILRIAMVGVCIVMLCIVFYDSVNRITATPIREYTSEVTCINYKGGGTAYFKDPEGTEQNVSLNEHRIIIVDEDSLVKEGDILHIRELNGFFNMRYNIIVEKK